MSQEIRKQFNESFTEELKNLNPSQAKAVNTIEGPVLVIAGPGTGKTHILSARIGKILQETDALPHNILCLTFTDAGVLAMRERLQEFIGPEAHKVHINTFHSFCNLVIQENMELFGRYDLEPISDLERIDVIREMIDEQPEDNILKKGRWDIYFYEQHLKNLFKQMKSEYWTSEFINEQINDFIQSIPHREEYIYKRKYKNFKKGDLKTARVDEITERMEKLRAAAILFPLYKEKMQARGRYDYEDMILWVLEAFNNNKALLRRYQEQYLYFLIDEYQDTNGAQNAILGKLMEYWAKPNVFVVGDDDQSIFEFQGARLKNIMDFYKNHLPAVQLVMLKENYRSSQNILDASKAVIDKNEERITRTIEGLDKHLVARNDDFAASNIRAKIIEYPNKMHEDAAIANQIERLYKEGFPLNEVAVIYAKHKQARTVISLLDKKRIPYTTKRRVNILDLPIIQNMRTFLEYLYLEYKNPNSGEELLFRILHFNFLGISTGDLAKISTFQAKAKYETKAAWRDLLSDNETLSTLKLRNKEGILDFAELIDQFLGDFSNLRILTFLEKLINRSGLLRYILDHEDSAWLLQIIGTFFDFVRREADKNPRLSLKRLLDILENMDANRLAIGVNKTITAENGVNLLTAHGAKGLEFQVVFMLDCGKDWEPGGRGYRGSFSLPDTLTLSTETDELESRRRLFYVAMTRAKEQLNISFAKADNSGSQLQKTQFIDEILEQEKLRIQVEKRVLPKEELIAVNALLLTELQSPGIMAPNEAEVAALLENFSLSVSAMNRYMNCPLSFYYENVLRIPSVPSEAASYGTAMHNALQRFFNRMLADPAKKFPPLEDLVMLFETDIKRRKHYFSKKGFTRRLRMGKRVLTKYYESRISTWEKSVIPELDVRNVEVRGVPLKGTLDKLILRGDNETHILDYKTGSLDDKKMKRPKHADDLGGLYWRQLFFYKVLYDGYRSSDRKATSGEIAYLETDSKGTFPSKTVVFDDEGVRMISDMIEDTHKSIMEQDFYKGCGKPTCKWCNFVKRNIMPDTFTDEEAEDLDD